MAILASPEEKKLEQQTTQQQSAQQQATQQQAATGSVGNELNPSMSTPQQAQAKVNTPDPLRSMYDRTMETLRTAATTTPVFESDYDANIRELYEKIVNREGFRYDYSTDPLYGQYRENYVQQGRQAMRDTMGQTAALTGGYGNSYGSVAGQQTYDAYLGRLNDILPELEAQAYSRYQQEGDRLAQHYALAGDMRDTQFEEFRTAVGDWQYDKAAAQEEAFQRASLGDWDKYKQLYGDAAAKIAQIMSNPHAAWASGVATPEEIYKYTGTYPVGYTPPGSGGGSSGGGGWSYNINPYSPRESTYAQGVGAKYEEAVSAGLTPSEAYTYATGYNYTGSKG